MSDMRRLIESMDKISEAGPKGLQRPGLELGPEMGGGGGGGGGPSATAMARLPILTQVVKPPPPAVWRNRAGQITTTAPGTTASQPLPPGVTPSAAGAGRGTAPVTQPPVGRDAGTAKERLAAFDKLAKEISTGSRTKTVKKDTDPVGSYKPGGTDELGRREPGTGKINSPTSTDSKKPEDAKKSGLATAVDRVMKPVGVAMDVATAGTLGGLYLAGKSGSPTAPGSEPAPATSTAPPEKKSAAAAPAANSTGTPAGAAADTENDQIERNLKQMGVKETFSQKLLNDFINFVESKNKSKAK